MTTLYDSHGRKVDTSQLKTERAAATLSGVRSVWHASKATGLTPERLASILQRAADNDAHDYITLAHEMEERDPHYASVLATRKHAVCKLPISVESPTDDKTDTKITDAVIALTKKPWFRFLLEDLADALGKGFSVCEIMWDSTGRQWMPKVCKWRDQRFFQFDRINGETLRLIDESNQADGVDLDPYKFIVHYARLKTGVPIRGGLARLAATAFMCKSFTLKDWMAFAELFGLPFRIGKYNNGASVEDKATLIAAVSGIGTDAAGIIPETMQIELLEAAKTSGGESLFEGLANWLDKQVSKAVLGQTMTSDDGSSLAQAKVHNEIRTDLVESDALQLAATINRDLVRPFIDLNFGPQEQYPEVCLYVEIPEDLVALAQALTPFIDRGLRVEASVIRDKFGLPEPEKGAEVLGMAQAQNSDKNQDDDSSPSPPYNADDDAPADLNSEARNDDVDRMVRDALQPWQLQMAPILEPLFELAQNSKSADEFQAGLEQIAQRMKVQGFVRDLALATFKARGLGDATDEVG